MAPTATRRLADLLLGGKFDEFVLSRRAEDPPRPYRLISRDLWEATNGELDISFETLRVWFPDAKKPPAEKATA